MIRFNKRYIIIPIFRVGVPELDLVKTLELLTQND